MAALAALLAAAALPAGRLVPGWSRRVPEGTVLTQLKDQPYDPDIPFWVVQTDKSLIPSHSGIIKPAFVDVIRQMYDDTLLDEATCAELLTGDERLAARNVRKAVNKMEVTP